MAKNMVSTQNFLSYVSCTMDCESPEEKLLVIVASNSPAKCVKIITELREYRFEIKSKAVHSEWEIT